jgi:hypothetical protein
MSTTTPPENTPVTDEKPYEEFEIGQDRVPWFLWVFFTLIVTWASVSWIKVFGY